jgi:hypothetical protein
MTLNDVRTAIVDTMKADKALTALQTDCRTHRGRFTVEDLKTVAARPLSVLVSFLAVKSAELQDEYVTCRCVWGAFIVAVDRPQLPRDAAALVVLSRLLTLIPGNGWGLDMTAPEAIESANLYSGKLDEKGVAIIAVTWEQDADLEIPVDEDAIGDFLKFFADYDLAPIDGKAEARDEVTLPGPPQPPEEPEE